MTSIEELNPELKGIGNYEFGWADKDVAGANAKRGLVSVCTAGGMGVTAIIER